MVFHADDFKLCYGESKLIAIYLVPHVGYPGNWILFVAPPTRCLLRVGGEILSACNVSHAWG